MITHIANHFYNYSFVYFIIVAICIIGICYLTSRYESFSSKPEEKSTKNEVKGRGYSDNSAPYIEPMFYENFISPIQAQQILDKAHPLFRESTVVSGSDEKVRKSETAWLSKNETPVKEIVEKVCELTNIPFSHAEKMQVVKYGPDGFYNQHWDAACEDSPECVEFEKNGGQRKITMLIYLNDDFEGGETEFPNLKTSYKPKRCAGLLFRSLEEGGGHKCHPKALHAGVPVKSGQKYICNVWLRETPHQE
jgi:prolyl 4-hydroxylase